MVGVLGILSSGITWVVHKVFGIRIMVHIGKVLVLLCSQD